jgi:cytochrome c peroxidase
MNQRMARSGLTVGIVSLAAIVMTTGCTKEEKPARKRRLPTDTEAQQEARPSAAVEINPRLLRRFKPARAVIESEQNPLTKPKLELGRQLFHDPRLSGRNQHACSECHQLTEYGVDGKKAPPGGSRNTPTVYNTAGHFEFSDGKAKTIEEQAREALLSPRQTGAASEAAVVEAISEIPEYVSAFKAAFPSDDQPVSFENVGRAIGAFERQLTTRGRWDAFLEGDPSALQPEQAEGLKLFLNLGCAVCHTGEDLGGTMYEKLGAVERWPNQQDQGRYETTKKDADRMIFKVPTLRNVVETGPYFHDGSTDDLATAVTMMAKHQIGMKLEAAEVAAIVAWLKSLTGEPTSAQTATPNLPSGTARTAAKDPPAPQ